MNNKQAFSYFKAVPELLNMNNWEWQPETNNTNGYEPGFWMFTGELTPGRVMMELEFLVEALRDAEDAIERNNDLFAHHPALNRWLQNYRQEEE